jgi:Mg/Co/Ni transporter MgtE
MNTDDIIIEQFILEHPREAAQALEKLDPGRLAAFFNDALPDLIDVIIPFMSPHLITAVIESMRMDKAIDLFESLETQYAVLLIRLIKEEFAKKISSSISEERSSQITRLIKYTKNTAGSHMDPSVFTLSERMTVREARETAKSNKKRIYPDLYVLTSENKLAGTVHLSDLITEDPERDIRSIMNTRFHAISPETPIQSILNHKAWLDHYILPVVDRTSVFLGVIHLETIRNIQVELDQRMENIGQTTVNALGELYQIGLAALINSATDLKPGLSNE